VDKSIEVEMMDLHGLDEFNFVFIYVDVGKMPPQRVEKYLKRVKENLTLCEKLDVMGVSYNLIPCRDKDNCHVSRAVMAEIGEKESQLELELEPIEDNLEDDRKAFTVDIPDDINFNELVNKVKTLETQRDKYRNFENAEKAIDK